MYRQPFGLPVQIQSIAIEMVVGRHEMRVFMFQQEINHATKLARQINVIVFREIDDIGILLLEKNVDLPTKCCLIANSIQIQKGNILWIEVFGEEIRVLGWTAIQKNPNSRSQSVKGVLERLQAYLRKPILVVTAWKRRGDSRNLRIYPIGDRDIVGFFLIFYLIVASVQGYIRPIHQELTCAQGTASPD